MSRNAEPSEQAIRLLHSQAAQLWQEGRKTDITFPDALHFWGVWADAAGIDLDEQISRCTAVLRGLSAGKERDWLQALQVWLGLRFSHQLALVRERAALAKPTKRASMPLAGRSEPAGGAGAGVYL